MIRNSGLIPLTAALLLLLSAAGWAKPAGPQGYVSDYANALSPSSRAKIENICENLSRKTGAQMAVVILPSVRPLTIEQYAVELFQEWGIGQKGEDNGVLLIAALRDREIRLEVGYGLEGILTDAMSRSIIERIIIPPFREGNYAKGIEEGVTAVTGIIAKEQGLTVTAEEERIYQSINRRFNPLSLIFVGILMFLFIKNPRLFLFWMMMSMMGGGRRGSGGFGGGFGGFGGGMSGGGGASGRW